MGDKKFMIDKNVQTNLNDIDTALIELSEINKKLYYKLQNSDLDYDTTIFLISIIEELQKLQLDLKYININLIKDFIVSSYEKRKLLCQTMAEKSDMEQEQNQIQIELAKFISDRETTEPIIKRKKNNLIS